MNDKLKFMFKGAIWIAIITTILVATGGLLFGAVIEATLFEEIAKYAFVNLFIIIIFESFWYTLGQVAYHWSDGYKGKYGDEWFTKGIKEDFEYLKKQVTGKKVLKVVLYYVAFFAFFGLICWILP